ncbi:Phosphopantetheinyl transferase (holo-ACP synthase) (AcpS) (PDB:1F7L) [Commensalibacter communis]|uniref:Holo-[acyl-carrier-protein] synthase n=1 Tax=Commensalibacter communis TaxID=2972786 RepID=A0A9W4TPW4_9PROT|nr:holo-ACP synthase [Commensalibacter communis]CAI3923461.1 Phosphopantetheinyl transferase (holo-ACP synthase) (AcpS) (PDB:1F7L) [Commensalibacter communis]CAI3923988.1 Phosphopantetheinyl transferase (holo-ACP synthase) (AcpS) (PDB:1F7L) [Commensalibacter communis]CAI3945787.1 Phosphopantetheinyl transferase (holo-ACP synthase) (AcpS) (PDB:1F7L) [Commensalibacter communis]CAI3946668.1 Phosphopantetheinyl transferase (holo-ACP synthase) (AcpS) (PDB:1F7L) [Commensalibacter communis]CAI3947338
MIVGIGSDLCDMRRIEAVLERHGDRFKGRIFTSNEIKKAEGRYGQTRIGTYAKRWAAKEACAKALGTGFNDQVFYHDIEVINLPSGQPSLKLTNGALERLRALGKDGYKPNLLLTMTDEHPYAFAQVMIELLPNKE